MRYFCPECRRPLTSPTCVCGFSLKKPRVFSPYPPSSHIVDLPTYFGLKFFNSKRIKSLKYRIKKLQKQKHSLWDTMTKLDQENRDLKIKLRVHETKPIVFKFDYEKGLVTCETNKGHRFQDYNKVVEYAVEYNIKSNKILGLTIEGSKVQQG